VTVDGTSESANHGHRRAAQLFGASLLQTLHLARKSDFSGDDRPHRHARGLPYRRAPQSIPPPSRPQSVKRASSVFFLTEGVAFADKMQDINACDFGGGCQNSARTARQP